MKFALFLLPFYFTYFTYCTEFEVDMAIDCQVIALLLHADALRDLVTLTFDIDQLTYMAGHVVNTDKKVRRSYAYPFLSYEL